MSYSDNRSNRDSSSRQRGSSSGRHHYEEREFHRSGNRSGESRDAGRSGRHAHEEQRYDEPRRGSSRRSQQQGSTRRNHERNHDVYVHETSYSGGRGSRGRAQYGNHGQATGVLDRLPSWLLPLVGAIIVVLLALFLMSNIFSCATSGGNGGSDPAVDNSNQPIAIKYSPSIAALDSINGGTEITAFSVADEGAQYVPSLSEEGTNEINNALAGITQADSDATAGFVLLDLSTGAGFAYNVDQRVYGASSFKGIVLIYGCQQAIDTGNISISSVNSNADATIVASDNTSYYRMRNSFEGSASESLEAWLTNIGVSSSLANDTSFPHYSARESAKLWMNSYLYLFNSSSNQETTEWAKGLLSSTEFSLIRDGVDPSNSLTAKMAQVPDDLEGIFLKGKATETATEQSTEASGITVYNKAGWITGSEENGLCDAGIIEDNGHYYLLSYMSSLSESTSDIAVAENVISALWNQRAALQPEQGYVTE